LVAIFIQKCQVSSQFFFSLNLVPTFEKRCNLVILVKFIEADQEVSSRLTVGLC